MNHIEIIIIAIGLAMDAFAVAICKGVSIKKFKWKEALQVGLCFGGFQALMPIIGYFIGSQFENYIKNIDNYVVFFMLGIIGLKMIKEGREDAKEEDSCEIGGLCQKTLLAMGVATSIDALGVGVFLAFYKNNIFISAGIIGVITFIISMIGVKIGCVFGEKYRSNAEILGGVILILMGVKALI